MSTIRLKEYQVLSIDYTQVNTGNIRGMVSAERLVYHVDGLGSDSAADILRAVYAAADATIEASAIASVELVTLPRADCCDVAVVYEPYNKVKGGAAKSSRKPGDEFWSFDASGGSSSVKLAISTLQAVGDATLTANVNNMVGWNGKFGESAECSGVSVVVPSMRERCRKTLLYSGVTSSLRQGIGDLQGKVNSASFHGWSAGEVLFLGASIGEPYYNNQDQQVADVVYNFAIRRNESGKTIGGHSLGNVEGWDYAWGVTGFDAASGQYKVLAAFVSRVYDRASFSGLGIG